MTKIQELAINILKERKYPGGKHAYISAYQLAVLMYKEDPAIFSSLKANHLGGSDTDENSSWAQYLAKNLRHENIEQAFFDIAGLEKFSFKDESKKLRNPSKNSFAIFKYNKPS